MAAVGLCSVTCQICESSAKFHCNTCGDVLCAKCKTNHTKSNATRHHHIVQYSQKLDTKLSLFCQTHQKNASEFWCDTCFMPICLFCITKEHKGHEISSMTTRLSDQRDAMAKEAKTLCEKIIPEWEASLKQTQEIITVYFDDIKETDKELVKRAAEIHTQVYNILQKRRQSLHEMTAPYLSKLRDQQEYLADMLQLFKDSAAELEYQLSLADSSDFLQVQSEILEKEDSAPPPIPDIVPVPKLRKRENDTSSLEEMVGSLSVKDTEEKLTAENTKPASVSNSDTISCFENSLPQRSLIPTPALYSSIVISFNPRVACTDAGLAWVRTGAHTFKLMDRKGSTKETVTTTFLPSGITINPTGRLLIVAYKNNCIKSVHRDKKISTFFGTKFEPCGACCLENGDVLVTFLSAKKVIRYSNTGKILQEYNNIKFRMPYKVAASKYNDDIYINDLSSDTEFRTQGIGTPGKLLAVKGNGQLRYKYSGHE